MRYKAEALTVVAYQSSAQAIILSEAQSKSRSLAMRHARAMLEVQRAAKALDRSFRKSKPLPAGCVPDGFARLTRAVERLEAIEKEVRRG
jgi:hypothetical protein